MLKLRDVKAGYGKSEVLQGVTLDVNVGEVVTLVGANGAGKTTTLKTLCGIVKARSGSIEFDGIQITSHEPHDIVELGITMIPEGRQLFPFLTVEDNLLMGAYKLGARKNHKERLERVLAIFPRVKERLAQLAGSLSGGEQQMLSIGRALMTHPDLIILDEATEGLAPLIVADIWRVIGDIRASGIATLIVDRDYRKVLDRCDRALVLQKGQAVLAGDSQVLRESAELAREGASLSGRGGDPAKGGEGDGGADGGEGGHGGLLGCGWRARHRAEPVAALYEQGRVSHMKDFAKLEKQMVEWAPTSQEQMRAIRQATSPDRMDALVWAATELFGGVSRPSSSST